MTFADIPADRSLLRLSRRDCKTRKDPKGGYRNGRAQGKITTVNPQSGSLGPSSSMAAQKVLLASGGW